MTDVESRAIPRPQDGEPLRIPAGRKVLLNVGGGSEAIALPPQYGAFVRLRLDIDPRVAPDIVCDARELSRLPAGFCDAVWCSHNLEHYYRHDARKVLQGFLHVLKPDGFADVRVPDVKAVIEHVARRGMDVDDVLYASAAGPITVRDVLYGWQREIEQSGVDFYAHRNGFTPASLRRMLAEAGFRTIGIWQQPEAFELGALAFRSVPTPEQRALLGV